MNVPEIQLDASNTRYQLYFPNNQRPQTIETKNGQESPFSTLEPGHYPKTYIFYYEQATMNHVTALRYGLPAA